MIALALLIASDAFVTIEPALRAAQDAPVAPAVQRVVRGLSRGPLLAEDINGAVPAARALEPAFASIDAATNEVACAIPADPLAPGRAVMLVDTLLVTATVDAASGRPGLAAVSVSRAADVARLLVRCDGGSLEAITQAAASLRRARAHTAFLVDQQWLDQKGALRAASSLEPPTDAEVDRAAGPRASPADVKALKAELAKDRAAVKSLVGKASGAPAAVEQGDQVRLPNVEVRCEPGASKGKYLVTRPVLAVLRARGMEAIVADSQLFFSLDGSGLMVIRAGPAARSCGFQDGDLLVDVNGKRTTNPTDTLAAPQVVGADGRAMFHVRRAGSIEEIVVEPKPEP